MRAGILHHVIRWNLKCPLPHAGTASTATLKMSPVRSLHDVPLCMDALVLEDFIRPDISCQSLCDNPRTLSGLYGIAVA